MDLYLFGSPVGVSEFLLMQDLTGLLSFGTPVGVTQLMLIQDLFRDRSTRSTTELDLIQEYP